jgi:chromosome partitioning protein
MERGLPEIGTVKQYDGMSDVIAEISEPNNPYDFVVVDSRGYTSEATLPIAENADMVIQPSGPTLDDLEPALAVFYELEANDIPKERLFFAITAVATPPELAAVRSYLRDTEYNILDGFISFQAGYRMALDHGASILESPFESLNVRANELIGSIFKNLQSLQK